MAISQGYPTGGSYSDPRGLSFSSAQCLVISDQRSVTIPGVFDFSRGQTYSFYYPFVR